MLLARISCRGVIGSMTVSKTVGQGSSPCGFAKQIIMKIFYLGKHRKRIIRPKIQQIKSAIHFIWLDFVWYCKWWKNLFVKSVTFPYHLITKSVTIIDKWDKFYDKITRKVTRYILLLYITTTISLQSFITTNRMEIGKLSWMKFLETPQPLKCTMPS